MWDLDTIPMARDVPHDAGAPDSFWSSSPQETSADISIVLIPRWRRSSFVFSGRGWRRGGHRWYEAVHGLADVAFFTSLSRPSKSLNFNTCHDARGRQPSRKYCLGSRFPQHALYSCQDGSDSSFSASGPLVTSRGHSHVNMMLSSRDLPFSYSQGHNEPYMDLLHRTLHWNVPWEDSPPLGGRTSTTIFALDFAAPLHDYILEEVVKLSTPLDNWSHAPGL